MDIRIDNALLVAAHYYKKSATNKEFLEDFNNLRFLKKFFTRSINSNNWKSIRMLLNQIVILNNLFGYEFIKHFLVSEYLGIDKSYSYPILIFFNLVDPCELDTCVIFDVYLVDALRGVIKDE